MTVSSAITLYADHNGNGVTTVFPFTFPSTEDSQIQVWHYDADGVATQWTAGVQYTLARTNTSGTVTAATAPPSGESIRIWPVFDEEQLTDLTAQARFSPEIHEDILDYIVLLIKQKTRDLGRFISAPSDPRNVATLQNTAIDPGDVGLPTSSDYVTEGSINLYHTASRVRAVLLTGLSTATAAVISASDSILSAFGKLQAQHTSLASDVTIDRANSVRVAATTAGTANAVTATFTKTIAALVDGAVHIVRPTLTNTSSTVTYSPDGLGPNNVVYRDGSVLKVNAIPVDAPLMLQYHSGTTSWRALNLDPKAVYAVCAGLTADVAISGGFNTISWDWESYKDLTVLHSTSSNPSRFTVPTGCTRMRLRCLGSTGPTAAQTLLMKVLKNGSSTWLGGATRAFGGQGGETVLELDTGWLLCAANDYFELQAYGTGGQSFRGNSGADADESYIIFEVK